MTLSCRLFILDMLLGNPDRLSCQALNWRGNPANLRFCTKGVHCGRLVVIDAVVQRRPPGSPSISCSTTAWLYSPASVQWHLKVPSCIAALCNEVANLPHLPVYNNLRCAKIEEEQKGHAPQCCKSSWSAQLESLYLEKCIGPAFVLGKNFLISLNLLFDEFIATESIVVCLRVHTVGSGTCQCCADAVVLHSVQVLSKQVRWSLWRMLIVTELQSWHWMTCHMQASCSRRSPLVQIWSLPFLKIS